ncbi:MAG: pyridoxamine 5'-phosphate oxidase family protein, partial [Salinivirgaceae bacterium]|nr:pyridoxamine 5'-phosphate oxidase family protein [Salinivirgaceae bacterium]
MDIQKNWPLIQEIFRGNINLVIASINEDGSPHISPIGSIYLRKDCTGYYLEKFPVQLPINLDNDNRICVYAVKYNLNWLKALAFGRFSKPPAVRLYGRAGKRRPVTEQEIARWHRQVKFFRWSKGYKILWAKFSYARELYFDGFAPVDFRQMT